jgi:uncharacterized membrane protein YhaH (DUF805 family)
VRAPTGTAEPALESVAASATKRLVEGHKWLAIAIVALVGGAFEGVFVGHWQWRLLRRRLPDLQHGQWVAATIVPVCIVWLVSIAPSAVDVMAQGGDTLSVFPNGFIQALVLGPLIGLGQVRVLRDQTSRWAWWLLANVNTYLTGAVMNGFGCVAGRPAVDLPKGLILLPAAGVRDPWRVDALGERTAGRHPRPARPPT